jgi:hypothetical protein
MSYLPCELHCHTYHSDGGFSTKELQKAAKANGLSLIALTDHNTFSGCAELDNSIIPAIEGIEWTAYYGHILVLGAKGFIDWRNATPDNIDDKLKEVKRLGGIIGIAHPFQLGSPFCTGGRYEFDIKDYGNVDYIEIFHEGFSKDNQENEKALAFYSELLDKGYRLAATYGRDWHSNEAKCLFGCTYIDFDDTPTPENALNAIKQGKTVASVGAELFFEVNQGGKLYKIGDTVQAGDSVFNIICNTSARNQDFKNLTFSEIKIVTNGSNCIYKAKLNEKEMPLRLAPNSWYRAELWGKLYGKEIPLAVTSPIYTN